MELFLPTTLEYSKRGDALTQRFEGCRLAAYQDSVGVWTIGFGHTRGVKQGDVCTYEQAVAWLHQDYALSIANVKLHVTVKISQGMFDALVDFDFNLGDSALNKSTLLRLVNHHDVQAAANEFEKWDHAGGKAVAGLLKRRLAEREEFLSEV